MANTHKVKDVWIFYGRSTLLIFATLALEFLNGNILSLEKHILITTQETI